jgi:hypothetical protein
VRLVCGPVLQLAVSTAIPRAEARARAHALLHVLTQAAHAKLVAHVDVAAGKTGLLTDKGKLHNHLDSALVPGTEHLLTNGEHLLKTWQGLLVPLEAGHCQRQLLARLHIEECRRRAHCALTQQLPCSIGERLVPLVQLLVAIMSQERPIVMPPWTANKTLAFS